MDHASVDLSRMNALAQLPAGSPFSRSTATPNAPKELGYLQRIEEINRGLAEIEDRLCEFSNRVAGGPTKDQPPNHAIIGLSDTIASAEQRIRNILQTLGIINEAF